MSPRASVRVQPRLADGGFVEGYPNRHFIDDGVPDGNWALHLTDDLGNFHHIALDLDGKTPEQAVHARADRDRIVGWLAQAGIEHLVCASGGRGEGWHIWIPLYDGVEHELVWSLRDHLKAACPSLDTAPLGNLRTGAVRPPYSPHASGSQSLPIAGDVQVMLRPTTTAADLRRLIAVVAEDVDALPQRATLDKDALAALPRDEQGQPYLSGTRRALSPAAKRLIETKPAGDSSAVLFTILLSMARARLRYADVTALLLAPGLEHARTVPHPHSSTKRLPRPAHGAHSTEKLLARQWRRAVAVVASTNDRRGNDVTFLPRAAAVAHSVEELQQRADAQHLKWATTEGAAARRVLDALHLIAVTAVTAHVDASIRMLACHTGLGRETVRVALKWLESTSWIRQVAAHAGAHAATWSIDPTGVLHKELEHLRSQAVPPAPENPTPATATRDGWRTRLSTRLELARHDLFTTTHARIHAGNQYARAHETPTSPTVVLYVDGIDVTTKTPRPVLDELAGLMGVAGTLEQRRARYHVERMMWQWWIGEVTRMRSTRRNQPALGTQGTWLQWGRFPRRSDGRASFHHARRELLARAA